MLTFLDHKQLDKHTHAQTAGLLRTSDQPIARAATYTTNTRDEHSCIHRDPSPRSQEPIGFGPKIYTARPPKSAVTSWHVSHSVTQCTDFMRAFFTFTMSPVFTGGGEKIVQRNPINVRYKNMAFSGADFHRNIRCSRCRSNWPNCIKIWK